MPCLALSGRNDMFVDVILGFIFFYIAVIVYRDLTFEIPELLDVEEEETTVSKL